MVLEKIILLFSFRFNPPFEKGLAPHLNKPKTPSSNAALWQVWFNLAKWFWRRLNCRQCISDVSILSPHGKGRCPSFYKLNLYIRGCFVSSLVEFGSGEEDENVKSLQTDGQTDRWQTIRNQKSSCYQFWWAKNVFTDNTL